MIKCSNCNKLLCGNKLYCYNCGQKFKKPLNNIKEMGHKDTIQVRKQYFYSQVINHLDETFDWLKVQINNGKKVLIPGKYQMSPGNHDRVTCHQLGYGLAVNQWLYIDWIKKERPLYSKDEYDNFMKKLNTKIKEIYKHSLVTVGILSNSTAQEYDLILWGANVFNYDEKGGGGGQAYVVENFPSSVTTDNLVGIITTPMGLFN